MTFLVKFRGISLPERHNLTGRQRSAEEMASTEYSVKCAVKAHSASLWLLCDPPSKVESSSGIDLGKHSGRLGVPCLRSHD